MKPFISIITPEYRVLPWYNLRLISVCEQTFDDWEWLILDNSQDGCVKKYVDEFFNSMQGVAYAHCKEKIKCWCEPIPMVKIDDGRIGILRNWLIDNTDCCDDGFILILDSDDFIFPDLLENIYNAYKDNPACEVMTGLLSQAFAQNINTGVFSKTTMYKSWINYCDTEHIKFLKKHGFENANNWNAYESLCVSGNHKMHREIDKKFCLKIPYTNIAFEDNFMISINEKGYFLDSCIKHPIIFKKKAFKQKIKKYITNIATEDNINHIMPFVLNDIVFINEPCYIQIMMVNDNNVTENGTRLTIENLDRDLDDIIVLRMFKTKYFILKDCMNSIKPIWWNKVSD